MPEVFFYQTNSEQEFTLRRILCKSRKAGWRILVRGAKQDRIEMLDDYLWKFPEDEFLPHGMSGGDCDHLHPILLTTENEPFEAREALVLIDGAKTEPNEVAALQRVSVVFESRDIEIVRSARTLWKALNEKGVPLVLWIEEAGGWVKKASNR
ncbi:MAG: DNA polymerase III subunit chi [Albidovulum sp.]|nr:DNA polymerase III subunit chi [Albidovulum sp.]MDE0531274.1 DNA polymerase III subunit chi [Albidovulum sp.]